MKKLYIWGAGDIGKRLLKHFDKDWEVTFVDSDKKKKGSSCCGREIISVEEYLKNHSGEFILIAHLYENESIEILRKNHIINYFVHCDLPGEFKEPYAREHLKNYVTGYLAGRKDYILYGLNLYSIVIDTWLYKLYGIHPCILLQDNLSDEFVNKVNREYKDLKIIKDIYNRNNIREICICSNDYKELKAQNIFAEYILTDIFDCSDKIENYHNPTIKQFYKTHKNQRCFIVATGPSLQIKDLDLLRKNNEICISLNHIFCLFDKTDWRPDYYVMGDYLELNENIQKIDEMTEIKAKFVGDTSEKFWNVPHGEDVFCYHQHYEYYYNRLPKFSEDFSTRGYAGLTVTYTCIQLAVYMGFKEIYLLGVDCDFKKGEINHAYGGKDNGNLDYHADKMILAYRSAEQYTKLHGVKIYNATRGGRLEEFERMDFESLFGI